MLAVLVGIIGFGLFGLYIGVTAKLETAHIIGMVISCAFIGLLGAVVGLLV